MYFIVCLLLFISVYQQVLYRFPRPLAGDRYRLGVGAHYLHPVVVLSTHSDCMEVVAEAVEDQMSWPMGSIIIPVVICVWLIQRHVHPSTSKASIRLHHQPKLNPLTVSPWRHRRTTTRTRMASVAVKCRILVSLLIQFHLRSHPWRRLVIPMSLIYDDLFSNQQDQTNDFIKA